MGLVISGGSAGVVGPWRHATGQWYGPPGYDQAFHNATPTLNQEIAVPFPMSRAETITGLIVRTNTGIASSTLRIGIRADNNGLPGTLLLDAGTVDTSIVGNRSLTVSLAVAASAGLIWITTTAQGVAPDMLTMTLNASGGAPSAAHSWNGPNPNFSASNGYTGPGGTTGALAASFGTPGLLGSAQPVRILVGF
jgi:hypothetical protein